MKQYILEAIHNTFKKQSHGSKVSGELHASKDSLTIVKKGSIFTIYLMTDYISNDEKSVEKDKEPLTRGNNIRDIKRIARAFSKEHGGLEIFFINKNGQPVKLNEIGGEFKEANYFTIPKNPLDKEDIELNRDNIYDI